MVSLVNKKMLNTTGDNVEGIIQAFLESEVCDSIVSTEEELNALFPLLLHLATNMAREFD